MRTRIGSWLFAGLLLASGSSALTADPAAEPPARSFELTYRAVITGIPAGSGQVDVWIPYPHSDNHQQVEVIAVDAPVPHQIATEPEFGNQVMHLVVEKPKEPVTIEVRARV